MVVMTTITTQWWSLLLGALCADPQPPTPLLGDLPQRQGHLTMAMPFPGQRTSNDCADGEFSLWRASLATEPSRGKA